MDGSGLSAMMLFGCPFRKFHPAQIRIVRQNHRIIDSDVCNPARAREVGRRTMLTNDWPTIRGNQTRTNVAKRDRTPR